MNGGRFESDPDQLLEVGRCVLDQVQEQRYDGVEIPVWQFAEASLLIGVPLLMPVVIAGYRDPVGAVIVDLGSPSGSCAAGGSSSRAAPSAGPGWNIEYLSEMLRLIALNFQTSIRTEEQIETVGVELARVYEELVLLHRISTNMRVTESDTNFLQLACDSLTDIVLVEGSRSCWRGWWKATKRFVVAAGSGLIDIDDWMATALHGRLTDEVARAARPCWTARWTRPSGTSGPPASGISSPCRCAPRTRANRPRCAGRKAASPSSDLMVAVNRVDKPDFDSTDIKLFTSVASGCAVFIENGRLFNDLKELFVGSLKALTNSIDAKDQYTRGHSERVALISRWIAERVAENEPLEEEQIHKIYLAGLLHDIGKIGIDEIVLRKNGKLTPEERACICRHPSIGASILARHQADAGHRARRARAITSVSTAAGIPTASRATRSP